MGNEQGQAFQAGLSSYGDDKNGAIAFNLVLFKTWVQKTNVIITWNNFENLLEFFLMDLEEMSKL